MSEYDVPLGDDAREFLDVADEKTERVCKEKLGYLGLPRSVLDSLT